MESSWQRFSCCCGIDRSQFSVLQRKAEAEELVKKNQPNLTVNDTKIEQWKSVYPYQTSSYLNAFKEEVLAMV